MHILVIGASRGIGLEVVLAALDAGHQVRAFARSGGRVGVTHERLTRWRGDALNEGDLDAALEGVDAVVQSLGIKGSELFGPVSLFSDATAKLLPAMGRRGVRRLIAVTGYGAGDSGESIGILQRVPFQLVMGRAYADKSIQETMIKASDLDWTIARPGMLLPGAASHKFRVLSEPRQWRNGAITRADVAAFIVDELATRRYLRQAPVLIRF